MRSAPRTRDECGGVWSRLAPRDGFEGLLGEGISVGIDGVGGLAERGLVDDRETPVGAADPYRGTVTADRPQNDPIPRWRARASEPSTAARKYPNYCPE